MKKIKIPTFADERGNLSVLELKDFIDWEPKRIYYVTGAVKDRGGHAVKGEKKIYICAQGTITARLHDGKEWTEIKLTGPDDGILVEDLVYRVFKDFSEGAVLVAVSNMNYEKDKYIYDFDEFVKVKNEKS